MGLESKPTPSVSATRKPQRSTTDKFWASDHTCAPEKGDLGDCNTITSIWLMYTHLAGQSEDGKSIRYVMLYTEVMYVKYD